MNAKDLSDAIAAMILARDFIITSGSYAQSVLVVDALYDARRALERALEQISIEVEP